MVYTLIAALPFAALIIVMAERFYLEEERAVGQSAEQALLADSEYISECIQSFYKIESAIAGNTDLAHLFLYADKNDALSVIFQIRALTNELERLPLIVPQLYGVHIFAGDSRFPERLPVFFHEYRLAPFLPLTETWRYNYRTESMLTLEIEQNTVLCYTNELRFNRRHIGYIQILMRMNDVFPFLYKTDSSGFRDFAFYRDGPISLGYIPEYILEYAKTETPAGFKKIRDSGEAHILARRKVPHSEILLIRDVPLKSLEPRFIFFRTAVLGGVLISIPILFLIIHFVTQKMMARLYILIGGMKQVREGRLDIQLDVDGSDEFADMTFSFNSMTARLRGLIADIKAEQRLLADTHIKAMENQINAHFLYNVLETIKMQAEVADQQNIVQSVTLLGKMMRYCLRRNNHQVSLSEELEYVRSYISLLNIQNDYTIRLTTSIEGAYLKYTIPKMLIQPLVENAFLYAIEPLGLDAEISITARAQRELGILYLEVRDYGKGMSPTVLEKIRALSSNPDAAETGNSIGIQNIQQRLQAFYGELYKLEIISAEGAGTLARIPIPLNQRNSNADDINSGR